MDRCGKIGEPQLFPARIGDAERLQAAAHLFAADLLLVGQPRGHAMSTAFMTPR